MLLIKNDFQLYQLHIIQKYKHFRLLFENDFTGTVYISGRVLKKLKKKLIDFSIFSTIIAS